VTVWFTADWHIGHERIIEYCKRPFKNVDEMRGAIIENFNAAVRPGDTVYHVGDVSLHERYVAPLMEQLVSAEHILIMGNHDACHPSKGKKHYEALARYIPLFRDVWLSAVVHPQEVGTALLVHHMPYDKDPRHGEHYREYAPKDNGRWLIHGHVHDKWVQCGRQINVGVDVRGFKPVSLDEILEIIRLGERNL
jgi:calcineurin-like phosphoesterase family protein